MKEAQDTNEYSLEQFKGGGVGLGDATLLKLEGAGISTIFDVVVRGSMEIADISAVDQATVEKFMRVCIKKVEESGKCRKLHMGVREYNEYRQKMEIIRTNDEEFDKFFGGGMVPEALYEFYGMNGGGKTQFCHQITIDFLEQFPDKTVIWIQTEDTFRPQRLLQIAKAKGYIKTDTEGEDKYFDKIDFTTAPNTDALVDEIDTLGKKTLDKNVGLIIIDGSIGQFRAEYLGRGTLARRQNNLSRFMNILKCITFFFSCTVVMTNQVQAGVDMFDEKVKPIGGNVVGHVPTYRIFFQKSRLTGNIKRKMTMVKSVEDDNIEILFEITNAGLVSIKK